MHIIMGLIGESEWTTKSQVLRFKDYFGTTGEQWAVRPALEISTLSRRSPSLFRVAEVHSLVSLICLSMGRRSARVTESKSGEEIGVHASRYG